MRAEKAEIIKAILAAVAVTGVVAVSFAPFFKKGRQFKASQIKRSVQLLKRNGLISVNQEEDKTVIRLTKNGKEKHLKFKVEDMKVNPQKNWDKKWRLVIFDVPVNKSFNRRVFTDKLKEMGFVLLQKSVWCCPYPCEDEIDFLKELYEIGPYVRIVTAEQIDIAYDLQKKFNLLE